MIQFGKKFDDLVRAWATLEDQHDRIHPDRNECGGVGGCAMMFAAVGLQNEIVQEMHEWRRGMPR